MGPILIFDKSVLQSLNVDEANLFDHFYLTNITPLFFIETLADLEKEVRIGRTPEDIVGNLALKTPDMHSKQNIHHRTLLEGELAGLPGSIDMSYGRPHIGGGRTVELAGKTGTIFQPSPEEEAMLRWQNHDFLQLERQRAKKWRESLSNINFEDQYQFFQSFFPISKPKTLPDVKRLVDFHIDEPDQEKLLVFGLTLIGTSQEFLRDVVVRWRNVGKPPIRLFAPYFTYVLSVDLFFYIAIAADLISRGRASHKIDIAYLYYLPFCMVFTSNDNLHAKIAPFFLRNNQTFILGTEIKEDLVKLDAYYSTFSPEILERGIMSFARRPPHDNSFLITRLWNKHMNKDWKDEENVASKPVVGAADKIMKMMRDLKDNGVPVPDSTVISSDQEGHSMIIERKVLAKKGKWPRFPKEMLDAHEETRRGDLNQVDF